MASTSENTPTMIAPEDFNPDNLFLNPIYENDGTKTAGIRYNYSGNKNSIQGEKLCITSGELKQNKPGCGIPTVGDKFHETIDKCMAFWVPLVPEDSSGAQAIIDIITKIDTKLRYEINEKENENCFVYSIDKTRKKVAVEDLRYTPALKIYTPAEVIEKQKEDKKKNKNKSKTEEKVDNATRALYDGEFRRIKLKIAVTRPKTPAVSASATKNSKKNRVDSDDDDLSVSDQPVIRTTVCTNDANGLPKDELETISSLEDIKKYFMWNCTAQFVLEFGTLWMIPKKVDGDHYIECGITINCLQIYVSSSPQKNKIANTLRSNAFARTKSITPAASEESASARVTSTGKNNHKSSDEEDDEDDDDDDDDEEEPIKETPPPVVAPVQVAPVKKTTGSKISQLKSKFT